MGGIGHIVRGFTIDRPSRNCRMGYVRRLNHSRQERFTACGADRATYRRSLWIM